MAAPEPTDAELIDSIARKDPDAVRSLYRRHGRTVYGVALAVLGDAPAAEEVTQDVFLRVWERADTYRADKARVITWLARIARNRAIDVLRQGSTRAAARRETETDLEKLPDAGAADPGDTAQQAWQRRMIRAAVALLPADQRRALSLAFFQGLTHRQIAEHLGEPLGTVKTRIRDAMRRLRERLGEESS